MAGESNRGPSIVMGDIQWGPNRYPMLWVWEAYGEKRDGKYGEYYSFPLHRLTAYAHGIIDHPRFESELIAIDGHNNDEVRMKPDPREVHHIDEDKQNGMPDNLEAHEPEEHIRITHGYDE